MLASEDVLPLNMFIDWLYPREYDSGNNSENQRANRNEAR